MGAGANKNGGKAFRKKSSQLKNTSRILKKTQGFDKKLSVLEATSLSYPTQKIAWGYPVSKRGLWDSEQHELSLKNSPESHEFCVFGIHIEH